MKGWKPTGESVKTAVSKVEKKGGGVAMHSGSTTQRQISKEPLILSINYVLENDSGYLILTKKDKRIIIRARGTFLQ